MNKYNLNDYQIINNHNESFNMIQIHFITAYLSFLVSERNIIYKQICLFLVFNGDEKRQMHL